MGMLRNIADEESDIVLVNSAPSADDVIFGAELRPAGLLDALEQRFSYDGIADCLHTERFRPTVVATGEGGAVTFAKTGTAADGVVIQTCVSAAAGANSMPSAPRSSPTAVSATPPTSAR